MNTVQEQRVKASAKKLEEAKKKQPSPEALAREPYEDLIWALLNTKEFLFNH